MWKIRKLLDREFVVLSLSGRIEADQLAELERILASEAGDQNIVLDLEEVKLVDQDVVGFLARCESDGIRLAKCPAYIREWITRRSDVNGDAKGE
jgi:anti-anti-sigma regulatory factor